LYWEAPHQGFEIPGSVPARTIGCGGRTIITADLDYPRLLALAGANGPSLILFRGGNWSDSELMLRMGELLMSAGDADTEHSILVVDRNRLRCRRLPIK
jgi:hypothetical protein